MTPEDFHTKLGSFPAAVKTREFTPSPETYRILKSLLAELANEGDTRFFEIWENEAEHADASRRAGSIMAHAYMRTAATCAIFGAVCAGVEPDLELWVELAREHYRRAHEEVSAAMPALPAP